MSVLWFDAGANGVAKTTESVVRTSDLASSLNPVTAADIGCATTLNVTGTRCSAVDETIPIQYLVLIIIICIFGFCIIGIVFFIKRYCKKCKRYGVRDGNENNTEELHMLPVDELECSERQQNGAGKLQFF